MTMDQDALLELTDALRSADPAGGEAPGVVEVGAAPGGR